MVSRRALRLPEESVGSITMVHVVSFMGTRPEAVKMAPVVRALRAAEDFRSTLVSTGQHREMLDQALANFDLKADMDLAAMQPNQTLASLSSRLFDRIDKALADLNPDWVLVQGDTTTVMVAALCAFYRNISVGHVEAGLRSHDIRSPFPEELNRRVGGLVASLHFAPTELSAENLRKEGVPDSAIHVTGNTGIDAFMHTVEAVRADPPPLPKDISDFLDRYERLVLITGHRRENFGDSFKNICRAICRLAERRPEVGFIYPVHLNPQVQKPVRDIIRGFDNVLLTEPQQYKSFVRLMDRSHVILTDSGGVQEEAPSLGKPVLVMRDVTERPEGVAAGCAELVGSSQERIYERVAALLENPDEHAKMARVRNPYGDGKASGRIVAAIRAAAAAAKT